MKKLLGLGGVIGGAIAGFTAGATSFLKDSMSIFGGYSGPNSPAGRVSENVKQTELFTSITTGVRGFFVGIAEFFKIVSDLMSGKIDFRGMMNGTVDIKGALASADNRAPDARPTTPDQVLRNIPSALSGLAAENPATGTVATTSIAASLLSRVTNGSWNPLNVFRGVAPAGLVAQTADDAGRGLGGVLKSVLGKLPWYGKAGVLVGVGVGANSILSSDALAAPSTPVAPLNRTPSGVPAIAPVVSETAPTGRSLAINAINGAYSGALNGVATFAGAPVDGATWLINKTVGRGLGFQIDRPFLGSESINNGLTGLRGAYHRATGNDLDRVQPANTAERVAYEGASFAGNLAASGGALGLLRGAWAKVASGVFTPTAPVSHAAPISRPALAGGTMDGFHMN